MQRCSWNWLSSVRRCFLSIARQLFALSQGRFLHVRHRASIPLTRCGVSIVSVWFSPCHSSILQVLFLWALAKCKVGIAGFWNCQVDYWSTFLDFYCIFTTCRHVAGFCVCQEWRGMHFCPKFRSCEWKTDPRGDAPRALSTNCSWSCCRELREVTIERKELKEFGLTEVENCGNLPRDKALSRRLQKLWRSYLFVFVQSIICRYIHPHMKLKFTHEVESFQFFEIHTVSFFSPFGGPFHLVSNWLLGLLLQGGLSSVVSGCLGAQHLRLSLDGPRRIHHNFHHWNWLVHGWIGVGKQWVHQAHPHECSFCILKRLRKLLPSWDWKWMWKAADGVGYFHDNFNLFTAFSWRRTEVVWPALPEGEATVVQAFKLDPLWAEHLWPVINPIVHGPIFLWVYGLCVPFLRTETSVKTAPTMGAFCPWHCCQTWREILATTLLGAAPWLMAPAYEVWTRGQW